MGEKDHGRKKGGKCGYEVVQARKQVTVSKENISEFFSCLLYQA
jgi:hypothetical protein